MASVRHMGSQSAGHRVIGSMGDHVLRDVPKAKDQMGRWAERLFLHDEFSDSLQPVVVTLRRDVTYLSPHDESREALQHVGDAEGIADIDRLFAALGGRTD